MSLQKIKEQVEFYFSDSNYARDKFMIARAQENDGWISITVLLTFKRLQSLGATLENIKEAVKDSTVVEMKEDSLRKIQTQEYMDYINDKDISKKILYLKGFNLDMNFDDVKDFLSKYFTPVKITLRRGEDKKFKGSCFVECQSIEQSKDVLGMKIELPSETSEDLSKKQKVEPKFLEIMTKDEYVANHKKNEKSAKEDKFAEKVKANFIPRLYKYECDKELEIQDVKQAIKNCAFADTLRKVIRMKFIEDWEEKEFAVPPKDENTKDIINLKLVKLSEDEAKEYVKNLNIKKTGNKRH